MSAEPGHGDIEFVSTDTHRRSTDPEPVEVSGFRRAVPVCSEKIPCPLAAIPSIKPLGRIRTTDETFSEIAQPSVSNLVAQESRCFLAKREKSPDSGYFRLVSELARSDVVTARSRRSQSPRRIFPALFRHSNRWNDAGAVRERRRKERIRSKSCVQTRTPAVTSPTRKFPHRGW